MIESERIRLCPWGSDHRAPFAAMHADPVVMADQGGPIDLQASQQKLARYVAAYEAYGFCRWALESRDGHFLGYVGVMPSRPGHPLGAHFEIGWRLTRAMWGQGYASEGARLALDDFFARGEVGEVLSYTAPVNLRSQAVMERLGLRRDASRDFLASQDAAQWQGLVWVASRR